jgi:hypothetical protein
MFTIDVGYYPDRNKARVPIGKNRIQSCYSRRPKILRGEVMDGFIVITDMQDEPWVKRND